MNRAHRIAIICGALPLVLGLGIFLAWLATGREWLALAGIYTIYLGLVSFVTGMAFLARYWWLASRSSAVPRNAMWSNLAGALVLLLANFPAALGMVGAAVAVDSRYLVVVHNRAGVPLTEIRLWGGGASAAIFAIAPRKSGERSLWFSNDGVLKFEAKLGPTPLAATVEGYVTNGSGGRAELAVDEAGRVTVTHSRKP